jgi:hypothetical protein
MVEMINIEKRDKVDIITFSVNKINATTIDEIKEGVSKVFDNPNSKVIIDLEWNTLTVQVLPVFFHFIKQPKTTLDF